MTKKSTVLRLLLAFISLCFVVGSVGCAGTQKTDDGDLTEKRRGPPEFFEQIPADTPYVMAGVEPMPLSAFSSYMESYSDFLEQFQEQMKQVSSMEMPPSQSFFMEVTQALTRGWTSDEGPSSVGFKESAYTAFYGVGFYPVYRLELAEPAKTEQVIAQAESKSGFTGDMRKLGEQTYRFYDVDGEFYVALAFTDTEMILGAAPPDAFDSFLPYMLGQKSPETSLADTQKIQNLIVRYGFDAFAAGYVDTQLLAGVLTGEAAPSGAMKEMMDAAAFEPPSMDPGCRSDWVGFAQRHPRMVFGYTDFTPSNFAFRMGLESTTDLPERLAKTKTRVPNYKAKSEGALAVIGAGLDVGALLEVLAAEAKDISQNPYACPGMSEVNAMATQAQMYLGQVPAFVRDMTGVRFELRGLEYSAQTQQVERIEAIGMIKTRDPSALLAQLQVMVPQFSGVAVKPDGVPVALGPFQGEEQIKVPHVAMTDDTLAVSIGVGMQDEMAVLLEDDSSGSKKDTPWMVFGYDYEELFKTYDTIWSQASNVPGGLGLSEIGSMFGYAEMRFDVTADGYWADVSVEMNPAGQSSDDDSK